MDTLTLYRQAASVTMKIFRWDLQLHFFWGLTLTLLGIYWTPLFLSGTAVTIVKEFLDLWSKGHWSWGDVFWGLAGAGLALPNACSIIH